ncbi:unnamed protein product [Brassica oleracea]
MEQDNNIQDFDSAYGPAWHRIIGTSFGSYVRHSLGDFLYFQMDMAYVLVLRTSGMRYKAFFLI